MDFSKLPVLNKLSPRQYEVIAYLISGGWNTFFGMGLYTIVYWLWGGKVHYMILTIPVNIAAISNAFLRYKLFVFRTKGNWLKEYLKCYLVYGQECSPVWDCFGFWYPFLKSILLSAT